MFLGSFHFLKVKFFILPNMSSSLSLDSRILVECFTYSLDSRTSVEQYNASISSMECGECTLTNISAEDESSTSSMMSPLTFKRVPQRLSSERLEFLTFEHQLLLDISKKCCLSDCLLKIGKFVLKSISLYYFSLNGEEQDTFLVAWI